LAEHRSGKSKSTKRGSEKDGIALEGLEMVVLRTWISGEEESPEYQVMNTYKEAGMALWCGYGVITTEGSRKGYKKGWGSRTLEQVTEDSLKGYKNSLGKLTSRQHSKNARKGAKEGYKKSLGKFTPKQRADNASNASKYGNHARWHVNRGIVNPDCVICKEMLDGLAMRRQDQTIALGVTKTQANDYR
jgi:hypothetical protein